ncbi:MAG TPA: iron ABC transporter permease [Dehalococcoidia bacterium]|jgi:iron complex transport system permease protein
MSSHASSTRPYSSPDRRVLVAALALVAVLVAIVIGVAVGPVYIGPGTVLSSIFGHAEGTSRVIVRDLRLPRVLVGAMVGASLAMSGAILQGVTRNPLADPHVVGISAGAGIAAVAAIAYFPSLSFGEVELIAFLGGLTAGALVYAMAWRGGVSPTRLALAGVAVTSMLTAGMLAVLVRKAFAAQIGLRWITGGLLSGRDWHDFDLLWPYFLVGTLLALAFSRQLNVISLGDDVATSLGQHVERTRVALTAVAALLASSAVSVAGLVGFVGLIIPHMARLTVGNDYRFLVPVSALYGAILLILADTVARTAFDPQELPVGVLTAVLGGPVFVYLVRRRA